jgi:hypothetical protein
MTDDELRAWAEKHESYPGLAHAILRLLDENAALRKQVAAMAERIHAQSELLSRKAERV